VRETWQGAGGGQRSGGAKEGISTHGQHSSNDQRKLEFSAAGSTPRGRI